jgi:hypothetical protein
MPGRYAAFATPDHQSGFYSEPVTIVVSEEDVSDVELKLLRGASISGHAVIEGIDDPAALPELPGFSVGPSPPVPGPLASARFGADGSFLIKGLLGDHELTVRVGNASPPTPLTRQVINVAKGKETNVILTLNLGAKADSR